MLLLLSLCSTIMHSKLYERQRQPERQGSDVKAVCSIHSLTVPAADHCPVVEQSAVSAVVAAACPAAAVAVTRLLLLTAAELLLLVLHSWQGAVPQ
jgi:hypothetical protein